MKSQLVLFQFITRVHKDYKKLEVRLQEQLKINEDLKQMFLMNQQQQRRGSENGSMGSFDAQNLLLQQQVKNLEERLEESYRSQHQLENLIEEYEVNLKRIEDNYKQNNKKFHDLQKKYSQSEQQKRDLSTQMRKIEQDKKQISEKWVKLSHKNKNEERQKSKIRELETQSDFTQKEINNLSEKLEKLERENIILKKTNEGANEIQQKQLNQIRKLQETISQYQSEKGMADKVTGELLGRIQNYEEEINHLNEQINSMCQNQRRDSESHKKVEQLTKELNSKATTVQKKEEIIEQLKKDFEKTNQQLINKNMDNQQLKQSLAQLQNEMMSLQNELEVINHYTQIKDEAKQSQQQFSTQQIQQSFQALQQLLNTKFCLQDDESDQDIEVHEINSFNYTDNQMIYDNEVQFTILRAEKKLRNLFNILNQEFSQDNQYQQQQNPLGFITPNNSNRQQQQQQYQPNLQQQMQQQHFQNDQMHRQQVKIQNLVIQNHAGVQEKNHIININTNAVICNKENMDMNQQQQPRKVQNYRPQINTQSIEGLKGMFDNAPKSTKNNTSKNNFQKLDSSRQLGPMKISNTPNALFNQNFQQNNLPNGTSQNYQPQTSDGNQNTLNQNDLNKLKSSRNSNLRSSGNGNVGQIGGFGAGQGCFSFRSNSISEQMQRRTSETRNSMQLNKQQNFNQNR